MALKVTFDKNASLREQMMVAAQVELDIIKAMRYAGENFVKEAREMTKQQGGFGDVTGNLRSSIGYFILKDGEVVESNLKGTVIGQVAARVVLDMVGFKKGYQLVGAAGMDYASHVESRGLNVISLQADIAIIDLTKYYKAIENSEYKFIKYENAKHYSGVIDIHNLFL